MTYDKKDAFSIKTSQQTHPRFTIPSLPEKWVASPKIDHPDNANASAQIRNYKQKPPKEVSPWKMQLQTHKITEASVHDKHATSVLGFSGRVSFQNGRRNFIRWQLNALSGAKFELTTRLSCGNPKLRTVLSNLRPVTYRRASNARRVTRAKCLPLSIAWRCICRGKRDGRNGPYLQSTSRDSRSTTRTDFRRVLMEAN